MQNLQDYCRKNYNENVEMKRQWGGSHVGIKSQHKEDKKRRAAEKEFAAKA